MNLKDLIGSFYYNKFFSRIFLTTIYCLQKEFEDCQSVLELGCDPIFLLQKHSWTKHYIGIKLFVPCLESLRKEKIHNILTHSFVSISLDSSHHENTDVVSKKLDSLKR